MVPGAGLKLRSLLLAVLLATAGCAELTRWDPYPESTSRQSVARPDVHVVQRGDTLFQIAFRYRLDWRQVAAWNRLGDANRIYPGQHIRLKPPPAGARTGAGTDTGTGTGTGKVAARPPPTREAAPARGTSPSPVPAVAGPPPKWRWPAEGETVWRFGESRRNPTGIGIGGRDGLEIRAAADGEVVYSGGGLIGYGQLIILKHSDSYLSAYGYNQSLRVAEGDQVKSGQVIALMGRGPGDRPLLHFEIRMDGKPVDPARHLPPR